jgi:hypothetical protein
MPPTVQPAALEFARCVRESMSNDAAFPGQFAKVA